jgi:transcriptional regulator GlxA family with amidase domain
VAEMSGFHNVGNFMKIFRNQIGQTPMAYRKNFNQTIIDTKNKEKK